MRLNEHALMIIYSTWLFVNFFLFYRYSIASPFWMEVEGHLVREGQNVLAQTIERAEFPQIPCIYNLLDLTAPAP